MSVDHQIRCPVHSFIHLPAPHAGIVATRVFQRLRHIRQLAMADLLYPGAVHTRFDHTLGVYHIARLLGEQLALSEGESNLVMLAALLHDLGHGPFSHVTERVLERYAQRGALVDRLRGKEKIHELVTCDIILSDQELEWCLSQRDREHAVDLLRQGYGEPLLKDIVSGPLDADKQDYLLRDSRFCGVQYGVFDLGQLHRSLCVGSQSGEKTLMIKPTGVNAVEQFVLAKYYLTTQVYRHRVRLITDNMLVRAMELGIDVDGIDDLRALFSYDGSPEFAQRYVKWHDARLMEEYTGDRYQGKYCHRLLVQLRERKLFKRVFDVVLSPEKIPDDVSRYRVSSLAGAAASAEERQRQDRLHRSLERRLAAEMTSALQSEWPGHEELDANLVILNVYTTKSVRTQSRDEERPILVSEPLQPVPFEDKSTLFRSIDASMNETYAEVYAPVWYSTDADRRRMQNAVREPILRVLQEAPEGGGE